MTFSLRTSFNCTAVIQAAAIIALTSDYPASAQQAYFMGLGDLAGGRFWSQPWDISADGSVVVGNSDGGSQPGQPHGPFRWTRETGMVGPPFADGVEPQALQVSADGTTYIGNLNKPGRPSYGARWNTDGMTDLPLRAYGVSGDGTVIVGHTTSDGGSTPWRAVRWTQAGGIENLPFADFVSTQALDVSADGSVVLGYLNLTPGPGGFRNFVWSAAEGLTFLNHHGMGVYQLSDNGKVVVGDIVGGGAVRWTKATGFHELGMLPDSVLASHADGASGDGSIIVGSADNGQRAIIWDELHGPRYLTDVLVNELGLSDALTDWKLHNGRGVSGDGRTVIGWGTNPNGDTEDWVAYLGTPVPEPSTWALLVCGVAAMVAMGVKRLIARAQQ